MNALYNLNLKLLVDKATTIIEMLLKVKVDHLISPDVSARSDPISGNTDAMILMTYCELYRRFLEELEIN